MQRYYNFHWQWCILGLFEDSRNRWRMMPQTLANWMPQSLANWMGQTVAYWIGQSVVNWIGQAVGNWIGHSVYGSPRYSIINLTCLVVRFCLCRNGTLRASKAATNAGQLSIHRSNAFTAMRGLLLGKYKVAKSRRFIFLGELWLWWELWWGVMTHLTHLLRTLYKYIYHIK